jgi:hypothetical protein
MLFRICAALVLCVGTAVSTHAQWLDHPYGGIPMKDGKPDLGARAPRTAGGKPDLSGVWTTDGSPAGEIARLFPGLDALSVPGDDPSVFPKYFLNLFSDVSPQDVPLTPEGAKVFIPRAQGQGKDSPTSHCLPAGIPMGDLLPAPRRFIQVPGLLVILYDGINPQRLIYTDGRKHPVDPVPTWMGYSVGTWEGDTLVVDTRGFNDRTWLDAFGHPRTEAMHMVERIHRRDFGHIDVQVTFDDKGAYTKPFTIRYSQTLQPIGDIIEGVCGENEKDRAHIAAASH